MVMIVRPLFGLGVATIVGTLFLAPMYVAIALVDFFSEPQINNWTLGKYRRNAPYPHLIVPAQTERRGQSAKTLVLNLFYDN